MPTIGASHRAVGEHRRALDRCQSNRQYNGLTDGGKIFLERYAFALAGALIVTLTCVPALTTVLLQHHPVEEKDPHFLIVLRRYYLRALRVALRFPVLPPAAALVILAAALALVPRLGTQFLPEMNEGDIHISVSMPSAVSLQRGAQVLRETRLAVMRFPEVKDVLSEQGHPEDGTDDEAPNQAELFVIMKPQIQWTTGRSKEQIVEALRATLSVRPGVVGKILYDTLPASTYIGSRAVPGIPRAGPLFGAG